MRKAKILKKVVDFGVREGLGVVPLAEVHLVRTAIAQVPGEGTKEKDDQEKINKETSTYSQPLPNTTTTSTQPSPSTIAHAPILTSSTTTILATTPVSAPGDIFTTTSTTLSPLTQVLTHATKRLSFIILSLILIRRMSNPLNNWCKTKLRRRKERSLFSLGNMH